MWMKKVKTVVHLNPEERKALETLRKRDGTCLSELIRRAVSEYIKKKL